MPRFPHAVFSALGGPNCGSIQPRRRKEGAPPELSLSLLSLTAISLSIFLCIAFHLNRASAAIPSFKNKNRAAQNLLLFLLPRPLSSKTTPRLKRTLPSGWPQRP